MAVVRGELKKLQKVWNCAKEKLNTEDIKKLLLGTEKKVRIAWLLAANRGKSETLQKYGSLLKRK